MRSHGECSIFRSNATVDPYVCQSRVTSLFQDVQYNTAANSATNSVTIPLKSGKLPHVMGKEKKEAAFWSCHG